MVAGFGDMRQRLQIKGVAAELASDLQFVRSEAVARSECASDRRSRLVTLLPPGREVLDRVIAARASALTEFAAELPEGERDALHAALLPIAERISSR